MKTAFSLFIIFSFLGSVKAQLISVVKSDMVWNGATTSSDGRIFVNFPRIEGDKGMRIGEVLKNGKIIPYPNEAWNNWQSGADVNEKFVRTNSLRITSNGLLWIVELHVKHISSCFGISPTYFGNYFRRNFDISFREYTNGYKMGLIEERLKIKSFPIKKIAAEFNFTDESHLSHFFRRIKKMTPLQFRNL